jgi:hypothetical protein
VGTWNEILFPAVVKDPVVKLSSGSWVDIVAMNEAALVYSPAVE